MHLLDSRASQMTPNHWQVLLTLHSDYVGGQHANYCGYLPPNLALMMPLAIPKILASSACDQSVAAPATTLRSP
jgi:hypothetical protein